MARRKRRRRDLGDAVSSRFRRITLRVLALLGVVGTFYGLWSLWFAWFDTPRMFNKRMVEVLATGYCNCEVCCGWKTDEFGIAVYDYGKLKGRRKIVGQTSSGTIAHPGTIAADPKLFRAGTRLYVPGYGFGKVEDIGGAIKGAHLDLWFPSHAEAKAWGRRTVRVKVL